MALNITRFWDFFRDNWRLTWALLVDRRVSPAIKLIPLVTVGYVLSPIDLLPDLVVGLGQLDDMALVILAFRLVAELAPPQIVQEHLARINGTARPGDAAFEGSYRVVRDES